jgi:hypothetical protein
MLVRVEGQKLAIDDLGRERAMIDQGRACNFLGGRQFALRL